MTGSREAVSLDAGQGQWRVRWWRGWVHPTDGNLRFSEARDMLQLLEVQLPWFWVLGCLQPLAWSCFSSLHSLWWWHGPHVGLFLGFIEQLRSVAWGHLSFATGLGLCRKTLCACVYFTCSCITSCSSSPCNRAFRKRLLCVPTFRHELHRNLCFSPSENTSMSSCPWKTVHFDRKWAKVGYGELDEPVWTKHWAPCLHSNK